MNQVQFLREQLNVSAGSPGEAQVNALVATYLAAKEQIADLVNVQAEAKLGIRQIIDSTGIDEWNVSSGKIIVVADSTIVAYDAKALDKLAADNVRFRNKVYPFRSESIRSGGIRISSK